MLQVSALLLLAHNCTRSLLLAARSLAFRDRRTECAPCPRAQWVASAHPFHAQLPKVRRLKLPLPHERQSHARTAGATPCHPYCLSPPPIRPPLTCVRTPFPPTSLPFYPTTLTHTRIYISTMPRRTDSDRHVPRNDSYMAFHGSGGTNAAHKMSWEVYNGVGAHMGGRPATQHEPIARAMGARSNLREKTEYGNKTLDARRDHRIIDTAGPELFMEAERGGGGTGGHIHLGHNLPRAGVAHLRACQEEGHVVSSACPQRHVHRVHRVQSADAQELRCAGFDGGRVTVETTRETLPDSTAGPTSLHARSARLGRSPGSPRHVTCFESPQQSGQSLLRCPRSAQVTDLELYSNSRRSPISWGQLVGARSRLPLDVDRTIVALLVCL